MAIKKFAFVLVFIFYAFHYISQNKIFQPNLISIEQEVVSFPVIYLLDKQNTKNKGREFFLLGGVNVELNSNTKIKRSLFLNYQYHNYTYTHSLPGPYIYKYKNISNEEGNELYVLSGIRLKYSNKKQYSGWFLSLGLGGGYYRHFGDNYLYNSRMAWCNSVDIGYIIGYNRFYVKPFVGILSIFNFKEFIDFNNGKAISESILNYFTKQSR
ncbi:MAG: hypothetical protein HYX39_11645 [Bacteroidetes bacterium]|nr:hypothetical protein [Bacteroidota bacterium]